MYLNTTYTTVYTILYCIQPVLYIKAKIKYCYVLIKEELHNTAYTL